MTSYFKDLRELINFHKKNLLYLFLSYFFILFSYPIIRSSVQAIFYETYHASDYSLATFVSIIFLTFCIFISNLMQEKIGVKRLFTMIGFLATLSFFISFYLVELGLVQFNFLIFALKESYIVLFVHLLLAYANNYFNLKEIKIIYGPLGALGSLGGIIGGLLTANLAHFLGTKMLFFLGALSILLSVFFFIKLSHQAHCLNEKEDITPLQTLKNVKKYIFLISLIVILSQWIIFIADLQFNISFEKNIIGKDQRTEYLGNVYTWINIITLLVQFIFLPLLLKVFHLRSLFLAIPISFFILIGLGASFGIQYLWVGASIFIALKSIDYSLGSVLKEILYQPLNSLQKYGAKYITDMFIYRLSKAFIALVFAIVTITSALYFTLIQSLLIILWLITIISLFREQERMKRVNIEN